LPRLPSEENTILHVLSATPSGGLLQPPPRQPPPVGPTLRNMLTTPASLAIFLCHFCLGIGQFISLAWLPVYFHERWGVRAADLSYAAFPYVCMACAYLLVGRLADHAVQSRPLATVRHTFNAAGFFGGAVCLLLASQATSASMANLCIAAYLSLGTFTAAGFETNKLELTAPEELALLQGLSQTLGNMSGIVGVPLAAYIVRVTGGWDAVFAVVALVFYLPAGLFYFKFAKLERVVFAPSA
jgi:cyanate permease